MTIIELVLQYGEAKYRSACEDLPVRERLDAMQEAERLLKEITEALHPPRGDLGA